MRPYMLQRVEELLAQAPPDDQELVHFTESLATAMIEEYSAPGGRVLDPFAGFGTTLVVAERLGRSAVGVELMSERVAQVERRIGQGCEVVRGDARQLRSLVSGAFDLCLTSPPYLTRNDHPEDPLQAYAVESGDYESYLESLGEVFAQVAELLAPGGHCVVNVANTTENGQFTPLAWDLARVLARHLTLVGETYLAWDATPPGIASDHCLVLRRD